MFFASLLAHELAHSLVARRYGLSVESITLWVFGGVSQLGGDPPSPGAETWIAGVGPLTSLLLGGIFVVVAVLVRVTGPARASVPGVIETALAYLGVTNLALLAFNVIPAALLDGGRLLRAAIWWRTGDRVRSAVWASRVGQVIGWLFTVGGLYTFFVTRQWRTWPARSPTSPRLPRRNRVADLLPRLTGCADRRALVLSDGRVVGIVSPSDITRLLQRLGRGQS